ncbi:30S ribosomal protein S16-2, chloroplastic/mitochondrial-like [Dioscorea cayenensis subsp. rotundata]|uniref:30S ribosomal protein S16-2, chloroplastic/mitochondrial-like n=1 Tax=Dioscorea cayennensis subsp. rotundata TaxID=55577 RepID=A0AB40BXI3_DIOCR|nr:30S ribosomal protein S16-2, chloroplastic/mitochondrial-like [Dioscorea cayenensis subsp. rotundata]XP_039132192.1 30S ribosomal protein S16-2, chloroplastic/mitochondrial-like [Dioscorea cayenensis subsp. rotundata]
MAVKIRLARLGCRNHPFYRLVVADSRAMRDGKHLEVLGFYDPLKEHDNPKKMALKYDRAKYWLSVGAQPTEPAQRILLKAGLVQPPTPVIMNKKGGPQPPTA